MITLWYRKTGETGYTEVSEANPLPTTGSGGGGTTDGALEATQQEVLTALEAIRDDTSEVATVPGASQDPIFDHANGTKTSVTASAGVITPPALCRYVRISTDVDIFVNTANSAAVDDGTAARIIANQPEIIPVVAGVQVRALSSSGTAVVRCTPLKVR